MIKHKVEEITLSARAPSLEASFSKIAISMFDIVLDTIDVEPNITKTLIIRAKDLKNLLYQYLKKLYDLANTDLFVLSTVKQMTIERVSDEYLLNTVIMGDKMNPKYEIKDVVKQVTERNINIKEDIEGTLTQINLVVERRNPPEEQNEV